MKVLAYFLLMLVGIFTSIGIVFTITAILNGFVLVYLWAWFVVPIFAAPALSIPQAIGLMLVVQFLKSEFDNNAKKEAKASETLAAVAAWIIGKPVITFLIGYAVKQFLPQ